MPWYVSQSLDQLGTPFEASSAEEAVVLAQKAGKAASGSSVTVRWDVQLDPRDHSAWWFARVATLDVPGSADDKKKAEAEAKKKAEAEAEARKKAEAEAKKAEEEAKKKAEAEARKAEAEAKKAEAEAKKKPEKPEEPEK